MIFLEQSELKAELSIERRQIVGLALSLCVCVRREEKMMLMREQSGYTALQRACCHGDKPLCRSPCLGFPYLLLQSK